MKVFTRITTLSMVALVSLLLISGTTIKTNVNLYTFNNRKIVNAAVLLYSFEDPSMIQFMQNFQEIQNQNKDKIQFTFYDGKNNIETQRETLDSLLKNDVDLFILLLVGTNETVIKDFILKIKLKNVPVIILEAPTTSILNISKEYDRVAFVGTSNIKDAGIKQGEIVVDEWITNKNTIDKNSDNILQYILLEGEAGNPIANERTKFFISTIKAAGIKTEELARVNAN